MFFFRNENHEAQFIHNPASYDYPFFYHAFVASRQPYFSSTTSSRRLATIKIRSENIISNSDFGPKAACGFSIFFVLHLKLPPLGDLGLDIDSNYCDGQLRDQNYFWFLKSSLEIKTVHFTRFVEKSYPRPQAVSSKDKIPFEEPH